MTMAIETLIGQETKSCFHRICITNMIQVNEYDSGFSDLYIVDKILNSRKQKAK